MEICKKCQVPELFIPESQFLILWLTLGSCAMRPKLFHLGARLTFESLLKFTLLGRSKNVIRFSIAGKLFLVASTVLKILNNLPHSTSVNIRQWEIAETLPNTGKAVVYKKLVFAVSIATRIAIQRYSKNASCIFNNEENIYYKNLEFTKII